MSTPFRAILDDRGVSRALLDLWIPHVDADAVWVVGGELPDADLARDIVPFVEMSPLDVAAVASEAGADDVRILAVFCSVHALKQASIMGLGATRVTITSLGNGTQDHRVGASVHVSAAELADLAATARRGFSFDIQGLPNVTARTWRPKLEDSNNE